MGAGRISSIEAGRAAAAILVVLYHVDKYYFASERYWSAPVLGGLFGFGHAGVEFFFVLSGLLMTKIHFDDLGVPGRVAGFARKRFARIYPFYWFCTALLIWALLVAPGLAGLPQPDADQLLQSLALVGNPHESVIFIAWTLYHEMLFYLVFALAIWRPQLGVPLGLAWFLAAAVIGTIKPDTIYPLKFINVLFLFGIGAGIALRGPALPRPGVMAVAGAVLFLAAGLDDAYWHMLARNPQIACYGLGAALALTGCTALERDGRLQAPDWLVSIGEASYAIYLTHMLILPVIAKLGVRIGAQRLVPAPLAFAALALVAIAGGVVAHHLVEKPLTRLARKGMQPRRVVPG